MPEKDLYSYKGYEAKVEEDEHGVIFGRVIDIHDIVTFQAKTVSDILRVFRESLDDYHHACDLDGIPPEKPNKKFNTLK